MPRRVVDLGGGRALLDVASYGRGGRRPLTPAQRQQIALTVRRVPEVLVKVSGGAKSFAGVGAHLAYIGREGKLAVEMDDGQRIAGKIFQRQVLLDWDLDLVAHRRQDARSIRGVRRPAKLVHNLIFSMPPGTPPEKVLRAVRRLAENEFALKHRYAMVLHTDEPHPHVHLVVKAVSERGERLNIRKKTLRDWRQQFAAHLRDQGIAANATERAVRGQSKTNKRDGIYRAIQRKYSTREYDEVRAIANKDEAILQRFRAGMRKLVATRSAVVTGWNSVAQSLERAGDHKLADGVRLFVARMTIPKTDQEQLVDRVTGQSRVREREPMERTR
jgi:hypothetical protein